MPFDQTKKLTEDEAEKLASYILKHGFIIFTNHSENERMPERGFEKSDVYNILDYGKVIQIEPGDYNNWKYKFKGKDLDGDEGEVVVTFVSSVKGLVITVF